MAVSTPSTRKLVPKDHSPDSRAGVVKVKDELGIPCAREEGSAQRMIETCQKDTELA